MARSNTAKQLPAVSETHNLDSRVSTAGIVELLAAGATLASPILTAGYKPQLLVPDGYQAIDIPREDIAPLPNHIRGSVTLNDQESFVDYVNRYKTTNTLVFATSDTSGGFTAIFDYHSTDGGLPGDPGRQAHTATYPCPASTEWLTWTRQSGNALTQDQFVEFIDANAREVVQPDSASLIELGMNFSSTLAVDFQSDIRRGSVGSRTLRYTEKAEAGRTGAIGEIKVPDDLVLVLPVFEGGKTVTLGARIDWKPSHGKLTVTITLRRPQDAIREALAGLRASIQEATGIKPMSGVVGK